MRLIDKVLVVVCCLISACSPDVELCDGNHPHRSYINFNFDWTKATTEQRPDSMIVVALRPVNFMKYGFLVGTELNAQSGRTEGQLLFPLSEQNVLEGAVNTNSGAATTNLAEKHDIWLRNGNYELVAYNGASDVFVDNSNILSDDEYATLNNLTLSYKSHKLQDGHPAFVNYSLWSDRNPYSGYVLGEVEPIYYAKSKLEVPVSETSSHLVTAKFTPQNISQNVQITFTLNKLEEGIKVDSIEAELSGVAQTMKLSDATLTAEQTYKVLFKPTLNEPDEFAATAPMTIKGEINVTGVVGSESATSISGAGIMLVNVYAKVQEADGTLKRRLFKAGVNLYNILKSKPSVRFDSVTETYRQTTKNLRLTVQNPLQITSTEVMEDVNAKGDVWMAQGMEELPL